MFRLIDTHAHLEEIEDLDGAIRRAKEAGVEAIVAVGSDLKSNEQVLRFCEKYKDLKIYPALGVHPWGLNHSELNPVLKLIKDNIQEIVAVGEIGLDFWLKEARKEGAGRKLQRQIFQAQLDMANQHQKPAVVHSRGAWRESFEMAVQTGLKKIIFHWYSGPEDVLIEILKMGYFISATPACEYSKEHQRAIKETPLENILLETDSPVNYRPESGEYQSEPKDVLRSLKAVARTKGIQEAQVAKRTTENAIKIFDLK